MFYYDKPDWNKCNWKIKFVYKKPFLLLLFLYQINSKTKSNINLVSLIKNINHDSVQMSFNEISSCFYNL